MTSIRPSGRKARLQAAAHPSATRTCRSAGEDSGAGAAGVGGAAGLFEPPPPQPASAAQADHAPRRSRQARRSASQAGAERGKATPGRGAGEEGRSRVAMVAPFFGAGRPGRPARVQQPLCLRQNGRGRAAAFGGVAPS